MTPYNDPIYAQLYDEITHDWPGEIDFYRQLIMEHDVERVLEVACGTGRVMLKLVKADVEVDGIDRDRLLLEIARKKAEGYANVTLHEGDMKSFDLGKTFQLAIIPGHSFQFMLTPEDQVNCLIAIRRHLTANGILVVHLDFPEIDWLGDLTRDLGGVFEVNSETTHPENGNLMRASKAWTYDPATQTASAVTRWEELDAGGLVIDQNESEATALHCVSPFEMEHLLARVGFSVENVYSDFSRQEFNKSSSEMIWVARKRA